MSRRKAREYAFKVIFQVDQVSASPRTAFDYLLQENHLEDKSCSFAWELIQGCIKNLPEIDSKIASYSRDWTVARMSSVDRNIMRIAAYEILYADNLQPVIAINEAIEISKKYGDENSASFINAILDRIRKEKKESIPQE